MIHVPETARSLFGEPERLLASREVVDELTRIVLREDRTGVVAKRLDERGALRVGRSVGLDLAGTDARLEPGADARGRREQLGTRRAGLCGHRPLEPDFDELHAVRDGRSCALTGCLFGRALFQGQPDLTLVDATCRLGLLTRPLLAADPRLARHRPRQSRAHAASQRTERKREKLEHAVRVARRERELDGEGKHLHRGTPRAVAGRALRGQPVTHERGLERRRIQAAHDHIASPRVTIADGRCVALRKQSRRELGEIVRSVPLQEEERPVAAHRPLATLAA